MLIATVVLGVIALDYATVVPLGIHRQWLRLVVAAALGWILQRALGPGPLPLTVGHVRASLRLVTKVVVIGTAVCLVGGGIALLASHVGGLRWPLIAVNITHPSQYGMWMMLAVVWAPLIEEIVYRGIVQSHMRRLGGPWLAIIVSGLSFWVYHWVSFGHVTSPHHLGAGLLLAWSYERTRSLLAPIILHAIGNFVLGTSDLVYLLYPQWVHGMLGWS